MFKDGIGTVMTSVPVAQAERPARAAHHNPIVTGRRRHLLAALVAAGLAIGVIAGVALANAHWPYRYRVVKPLLEDVLGSHITITRYHRTYFPHPGFVAEGITLRRNAAPNLPPIGSVKQLAVEGTWSDLLMLRERVQLVDIQGLHIVAPAPGSPASKEDFPPGSASDFTGPETLIEQLKVHDGLLEIMRPNGERFSFPVLELDVGNFQKGRANTYRVVMDSMGKDSFQWNLRSAECRESRRNAGLGNLHVFFGAPGGHRQTARNVERIGEFPRAAGGNGSQWGRGNVGFRYRSGSTVGSERRDSLRGERPHG
jgi:hypothetical protein